MSRPALRITRHDAEDGTPSYEFEVWDPFTGAYVPKPALDDAVAEVDALLERVRTLWISGDAGQAVLQDVPDASLPEDLEWAEFRASAQANRVHETRNFDALHWRRAIGGRTGALETTCNEVGYRPNDD